MIEERLRKAGQRVRLCLELIAESVSAAVTIYIGHKVRELVELKSCDSERETASWVYNLGRLTPLVRRNHQQDHNRDRQALSSSLRLPFPRRVHPM
jgi:hypothetical protein